MPAYLCHLCRLYNTFPSPLCRYCAHEYCIRCLPLILDPSPLQPSPIDSSITRDSSSISSLALDDEAEDLQAEDIIREYLSIHPAHRPATTTRPVPPTSRLPDGEEEQPDPDPDAISPSPEKELPEEIVVITTATPTQPFISPTRSDATKPPTTPPPPLTHKHSSPFPLSSFSLFHRHTPTITPTTTTPTTATTTATAHQPVTLSPHYTWPLTAVPVTRTKHTDSLAPPPQRPYHKRHGSLPEIIDREREHFKNAMSVQGEHLKEKMSVRGEKVSRLVRKGNLLRLREGCGKGSRGGDDEKGKGGVGGEGG